MNVLGVKKIAGALPVVEETDVGRARDRTAIPLAGFQGGSTSVRTMIGNWGELPRAATHHHGSDGCRK